MEHFVRVLPWLLLCAGIYTYVALSGWRVMRKEWRQPVTLRDYLDFSSAVSRGDRDTIKAIATKYGAIMAVMLFMLIAPVMAMASDQPYTLRSGSVQVGSAPGRVDMARPMIRMMTLGDRVEFAFTVTASEGANPCGGSQRCHATVGLRSYNDTGIPFTEVWSTFSMPSDITGAMSLDLPSTAPANILPRGRSDLLVSIVRGNDVLFESSVPVFVE